MHSNEEELCKLIMKKKFALDVSELKVVFGNGNTNRSQDKSRN